MDSRGYSSKIIKANNEASTSNPGVLLGRMCIAKEIPVSDVSKFFGVSRMTIYKWFKGAELPRQKQIVKIEEVLAKAKFSI
jgi:hypothetical protein